MSQDLGAMGCWSHGTLGSLSRKGFPIYCSDTPRDGELCTLWGSPFPAQTTGCWKDLPYSLSSNLHFTDAESSGIATLERQLERETAGGTRICRDSHCLFFCQVKSVAIH